MPTKHLQLIEMVSFGRIETKNNVDRFPVLFSGFRINRLLKVPKLAFGAGKAQAII